jgi:alkylation response protein AidB-like acyl-CoA dehydrogenase
VSPGAVIVDRKSVPGDQVLDTPWLDAIRRRFPQPSDSGADSAHGGCRHALELSVTYAGQREQFGPGVRERPDAENAAARLRADPIDQVRRPAAASAATGINR